MEAQARAQPDSHAPDADGSVSAAEIVEGQAGPIICRHCYQSCTAETLRTGCTRRLFHPGKYDSVIVTVWNGPDYFQYDAKEPSWTCCTATNSGGGCRARRHEAAAMCDQPVASADVRHAQKATQDLYKLCDLSVHRGNASHGETREGAGSGGFRSPEKHAEACTLIEKLGADVNRPVGVAASGLCASRRIESVRPSLLTATGCVSL